MTRKLAAGLIGRKEKEERNMFCPKCGKQIPDGSRFCSICGEKIAVPEPVVTVENRKTAVTVVQPGAVRTGGKIQIKKYIPLAAAVVGILALVLLVSALFSGSGKAEYAYLSGGRYYLISDLKDAESLELAAAKSDSVRDGMLRFSPDGKYVYYFTKYDYYNETGTLCRAKLDKLSDNPDKNDKYIDIIATNVRLGFTFPEEDVLLYTTGDYSLYFYNGKETTLVARDVESYFTDEKKNLIYITGDYWEGYAIYGVNLKNPEEKEKLDSDVSFLYNTWDLENILYVKDHEDGGNSLYCGGIGREPQKLDDNVSMLGRSEGKTWYTTAADTSLSLYDYVQDDYAAADSTLKEPNSEDYEVPVYTYKKVYGSDLKEENFPELYTSFTKELTFFQDGWWYYSMEEARQMDWGENTEELVNAIDVFITKHGHLADEDGFIKVTPEVRDSLLNIQKCAGEPENEWQWMWLCYNRQQTGTSTDWDAYNMAWEQWNNAEDRIAMRQRLKDPNSNRQVDVLKVVEDGKATVLCENVLSLLQTGNGILFNTTDMVTEKVNLEQISYLGDVTDLFALQLDAENRVLLLENNKVVTFSAAAADNVFMADSNDDIEMMYFTEKYAFLEQSDGTLSQAEIQDGKIGAFSIVSDDADVIGLMDGVMYYVCGVYRNNGDDYCELYALKDGKTSCLARDVMCRNIVVYEDGTILAYTDSRGGYELTMVNAKGDRKLIAENVSSYIRVDKNTLLILSGGDLFCYNGKSKQLLATDVEQLWARDTMEVTAIFY